MTKPTISQVVPLDGKEVALLTDLEKSVLGSNRSQGRKLASITIFSDADRDDLARASSREQADQILKRAACRAGVKLVF